MLFFFVKIYFRPFLILVFLIILVVVIYAEIVINCVDFAYPLGPLLFLVLVQYFPITNYLKKSIIDTHDWGKAGQERIDLHLENKTVFTRSYYLFIDKDPPISIYLYNISIPNHEKLQKIHGLALPLQKNNTGTDILEFAIHQFIRQNHYLSHDDKADAFLIPIEFHMYYKKHNLASLENIIIPMLKKTGEMYERYGGVDHIFIQMIFCHNVFIFNKIHEESFPAMMTFPDLNWDLVKSQPREAQRLTVCPYSSDRKQIMPNEISKIKKEYLFFLIGQKFTTGFDKKSAKVRPPLFDFLTKYFNGTGFKHCKSLSYFPLNLTDLVRLNKIKRRELFKGNTLFEEENMKSMVIQTFRKSKVYHNITDFMMKSVFCPVPYGDSPASKRLFDTFRMLCIPIVFSDQIRFPFEDVFIDYSKFIIQVPMKEPENLIHVLNRLGKKKDCLDELRWYLAQLKDILDFDLNWSIHNNDIMWAWLWSHYFKLATISGSKRRTLLDSVYL